MSDSQPSIRIQDLLEHSSWVHELAQRLVQDPAAAEDIAQSTWLAALQHPPTAGRPLRAWLGTVVRNFARQARRGESRRGERERHVARDEALPSTAELLERASLQREVASGVLELAEPYRTTILLRFFEGLPPREIARRLDVPVETVGTRLTRGIEKLRASLDETYDGGRRTWMLLLLPLTQRWAAPSTITGTALMNAKLVASIALVTTVGLGAWWIARDAAPLPEQAVIAAPQQPAELDAPAERTALASSTPAAQERVGVVAAAPASEPEAAPLPVAAPVLAPLTGVVLQASGQPAVGVDLVVQSADGEQVGVRSSGAGHFSLEAPPAAGRLEVAESARERWTTVMEAHFNDQRTAGGAVVVVAPRAGFSGTVLGEEGEPLGGVQVAVRLPEELRPRLAAVLDKSLLREWATTTDDMGLFELPQVPGVEGAQYVVSLPTYTTITNPLPLSLGEDVLVVLTRPASGFVRGRVMDLQGRPLSGAVVGLGADTRTTGADGSFAFELEDPESFSARFGFPTEALVAVLPGFLPARFEPALEAGEPHWPESVILTLADEPFGLGGHVTDYHGEPLAGARVWVADTSFLGVVNGRPAHVEGYLSGSSESWNFVTTDDRGAFEVTGLLDREYTVRVMDDATMLMDEFGPFQSGAGSLQLRLPTDQVFERVAGRLLSHGGKPVPGASVFPMCDAFQMRAGGQTIGTSHHTLEGVVTDSEGRFELRAVPRSLVYLRIQGETVLPLEYGRYVEGDRRFENTEIRRLPEDEIEQLEILVEQRCHMRVLLNVEDAADQVGLLDDAGLELTLNLIDADGRSEGPRMPLVAGRSETLAVPDTGRVLVLFLRGQEVGRMPVELQPGEVTEVRF